MNEFYPADVTDEKQIQPLPVIERMDDVTAEAMRRMSVTEKIHLVGKNHREVRRRVSESIRIQNHDWSNEEVHSEMIRTMSTATYESLTGFMPTNILDL